MKLLDWLAHRKEQKTLDSLAVQSAEYMVDRLEKRVDVLVTRAKVARGDDENRQRP